MARHALNHVIHQRALASTFPLGIFVVNVAGSILIGVVAGLVASERIRLGLEARTFVMVGLLGGFTTFSSFSIDTLNLARAGAWGAAVANVAGSVVLCLVAVTIGYAVTAALQR